MGICWWEWPLYNFPWEILCPKTFFDFCRLHITAEEDLHSLKKRFFFWVSKSKVKSTAPSLRAWDSAAREKGAKMEAKTAAEPLYSDRDGERGGGGKFKKPPSRKPPASPYARPLAVPARRGGWLAKLVDPAYRLISGGASRIMPSFLTRAPSIAPPLLLPVTESNGSLTSFFFLFFSF